jgi:hypothetical protein
MRYPVIAPINGEENDMERWSSVPAMIALAAVLAAPVIIEAENALPDPAIRPAMFTHASTIIGASVYNPQNERIGSIAEVLTPGTVLSLGGYRGIAGKLVEVPNGLIKEVDHKLVIASATKDQLMQLPPFQYGSHS